MIKIIKDIFGGTKNESLNFILVLGIIYCQYSLYMLQYSILVRLSITLILTFVLIRRTPQIIIKKSYMQLTIISIGCILLSCITNFSLMSNDITIIILWICSLMICSEISLEDFSNAYIKSITFLSLVGGSIYIISNIFPEIFFNLPGIYNQSWTGNLVPRNAFFAVVDVTSNYKRAFGIFYEPGLFAFHICMAIFLQLFVSLKLNIRRIIILTIGLILTFSTVGYAVLLILFFSIIFSNYNHISKRNKKYILISIFILTIFISIYMYFNPSRLYFLTSKIEEFFDGSTSGSGYERYRAIINSFNLFIKKPIFGSSTKYFNEFNSGCISTFTPFNWLAYYGLIYGLLCNIMYIRLAFVKKQNIFTTILKILSLILIVSTQNVSGYLILFIFIIYSFRKQ